MGKKGKMRWDEMFDWQNTFAPNDSFVYITNMHPEEMEKRSRSVNTKGITDEAYREQAYGMLRKRKNPKPNSMDKLMFEAYTRIGVYLPITAFVSLSFSIPAVVVCVDELNGGDLFSVIHRNKILI